MHRENDIGTWPVQDHAAVRQVDPGPAADQDRRSGSGVGRDPFRPFVATRVMPHLISTSPVHCADRRAA